METPIIFNPNTGTSHRRMRARRGHAIYGEWEAECGVGNREDWIETSGEVTCRTCLHRMAEEAGTTLLLMGDRPRVSALGWPVGGGRCA